MGFRNLVAGRGAVVRGGWIGSGMDLRVGRRMIERGMRIVGSVVDLTADVVVIPRDCFRLAQAGHSYDVCDQLLPLLPAMGWRLERRPRAVRRCHSISGST